MAERHPGPRGPPRGESEIEARRKERQIAAVMRAVPRGPSAEVKYFVAFNTAGVLSQNTWSALISSSNGVWASIAQGVDQDERIGRRIRVVRYRVCLKPSAMAYDTVFAATSLTRTDTGISASDLFVSSGSARSQFDWPNPIGQRAVHMHTLGTAMELSGAAAGATPSYSTNVIVHDLTFEKGRIVSYEPSGVTGPCIMTYTNCSETSISLDYGIQVWFEDA